MVEHLFNHKDPLKLLEEIIQNKDHLTVIKSSLYAWSMRSDPNWHNILKKEAITKMMESLNEPEEMSYWDFDIIKKAEQGDPAITKIHDPVCWILAAFDEKKNTSYENQYKKRI